MGQNDDISAGANNNLTTILRFAKLIPPVTAGRRRIILGNFLFIIILFI